MNCDSVIIVGAKMRNLVRRVPPPELATSGLNPCQRKSMKTSKCSKHTNEIEYDI